MKAMHRRRAGQAATAALLLVSAGWLGMVQGDAPDLAARPLQDAPQPDAGRARPADFPRRLNSSLSMPFFSFAQSLTPRS